jgi:Ca2+-binding RTX toxin-like protein
MGRRSSAGSALAAVFAALGLAASADGATVGQERFTGTLDVRAEPGEANDLEITVAPGVGELSDVRVRQEGGGLVAGDGCEARPDGSVACSLDLYIVTVNLGDGDDRLDVLNTDRRVQHTAYGASGADEVTVGPSGDACLLGQQGDDELRVAGSAGDCSIDGGEGADVLTGNAAGDYLFGGGGDDRVFSRGGEDYAEGGHGSDLVRAGSGDDPFVEGDQGRDTVFGEGGDDGLHDDEGGDVMRGGAGDDFFSSNFQFDGGDDAYLGGEGRDRMRYFCPACRLKLDGRANDGRIGAGERDDVRVETAVIDSHRERGDEIPPESYGTGADRMFGDEKANVLASQRGRDLVVGGAGPDVLNSGNGRDIVDARDGERDEVDCGKDGDRVVADPIDLLVRCERIYGLSPGGGSTSASTAR